MIGTGRQNAFPVREHSSAYPSLAQIAGHALNSIFLDNLSVDLERLQRINRTIRLIPDSVARQEELSLKRVDVIVMSPSKSIEEIADQHLDELPRTVRFLLRGTGAMTRGGANLASCLLFEREFCQALIALGYRDTMDRAEEITAFFR